MQAMNIDLIDAYLSDLEQQLLREYIEIEKTPVDTALFVSALSQLWIFGLYELLRTWRQRAADVIKFAEEIKPLNLANRKNRITDKRRQIKKAVALNGSDIFYWKPYEKAAKSVRYFEAICNAIDRSELLFRRIEALRMSLAKHEIPKSKGSFALAPGYGRIDMSDGSIYWQVVLQDNQIDLVSRRAIADDCRALSKKRLHNILPRNIQQKVSTLPKHSYGLRLITVVLKDGSEYRDTLIAWAKEVVHVSGHGKVPFDARRIVDVRYDASEKKHNVKQGAPGDALKASCP
jgi:hypothetical protein